MIKDSINHRSNLEDRTGVAFGPESLNSGERRQNSVDEFPSWGIGWGTVIMPRGRQVFAVNGQRVTIFGFPRQAAKLKPLHSFTLVTK